MELLALLAVILLGLIGYLACSIFFARAIRLEDRFYFAPALGMGICALVAYFAVHLRQPWFITVFTFVCVIAAPWLLSEFRKDHGLKDSSWRLLRFTLLTLVCLYGAQILIYHLYAAVHPGPHEVWTIYNLSGVSPPDQMFAWHQAMFAELHRHYPQDPFYAEIDLYDRPQLGGYVTLFFFKLFGLPLEEHQWEYPAAALRFYHSFWWMLNNLYLLGVAPLFSYLLNRRAAVLAVASTALGSFFFLCNVGGWMKFASAYPLLLALTLFVLGRGPVLQAALCAVSYYVHGSVIPFLAGFGLLQIISIYYPLKAALTPWRDVLKFALTSCLLIGAWFLTVRLVGSKQPLLYYYFYDAELTEAQTRSTVDIVRRFYAGHSWRDLLLLPVRNWLRSCFPTALFEFRAATAEGKASTGLYTFASALLGAQRTCLTAVLGLTTLPIVLAGLGKALRRKYSGRIALSLYLLPTLLMLVLYRKPWALLLHITYVYHLFALYLWVFFLKDKSRFWLAVGLVAIALEGFICVLFADLRFLPAESIQLTSLQTTQLLYVLGYAVILITVVILAYRELGAPMTVSTPIVSGTNLVALQKVGYAMLLSAFVLGVYSLYCLRFY